MRVGAASQGRVVILSVGNNPATIDQRNICTGSDAESAALNARKIKESRDEKRGGADIERSKSSRVRIAPLRRFLFLSHGNNETRRSSSISRRKREREAEIAQPDEVARRKDDKGWNSHASQAQKAKQPLGDDAVMQEVWA